ncbi:hypothetical protein CCR75_002829 [Bremia lactucae]|uniref:DUF676 domain-containing protein n=1 Tax=Bremia lactucae TaxID=4779 RepID=A0A976FPR6_BRELC|nr:hypothetical protein CCR75_002829 [Bremia lactucae]
MDKTQLLRATHLVVLQHGLLGSSNDFARFIEIFRTHFQIDELFLHAAECNATSFFRTYDGVDQGGQRLADEIQEVADKMPLLKKLSMVGHSLGGLYNRFCIAVLFHRGFFDKIEPMNFITFASPHLGIRRPRRGATNVMLNALMPKIFSQTGVQLSLMDQASEETLELSKVSTVHCDKNFYSAFYEVQGLLLCSLPVEEGQQGNAMKAFELFYCSLSDRKLRVFANEEEKDNRELKLELELSCAHVNILLPGGNATIYTNFISSTVDNIDDLPDSSGHYDIQIRWSTNSCNADVQTKLFGLRIAKEDVEHDWKWLAALSNASFGVRCSTFQDATEPKSTAPPLLSCLTRGQFMQALQMFQARTLYSSIFSDMQVPYSCAAVRAFNPYRLGPKKLLMSPIYKHIALDSSKSARKLRDTIPKKVKHLAMKYMTPQQTTMPPSSQEDEHVRNDQDVESCDASSTSSQGSIQTCCPASNHERKSETGSREKSRSKGFVNSRQRGKTVGNEPSRRSSGFRPQPFSEGDVILDQLPFTFTSDTEQDELRGMLLSLQSVGWRRIDVLFGGIMSHEHIIAKRADLKKPFDSGIDVVHHVMDTFLI